MTSERLSNTLLIASGKGGVGKTWLSINLAHALVKKSQRVFFFDGDLGFANVDSQLGLKPKRDLGSVLKSKCSFEEAIVPYKFHKDVSTYVDIIAGRAIDDILATLSKTDLSRLRNSLATIAPHYDHMIIDLSAGLDQMIQEFSTFGQHCLVLVTADPASIADALAFIKVTSQRNPTLPLHVVVNMANSRDHGQKIYNALAKGCAHFLKDIPSLVGIIHQDPCVLDSIQRKTPTLVLHPTSQVTRDIEDIANELRKLKE